MGKNKAEGEKSHPVLACGVMSVRSSVFWVQAQNRHQCALISGAIRLPQPRSAPRWGCLQEKDHKWPQKVSSGKAHRGLARESWKGKPGQILCPGERRGQDVAGPGLGAGIALVLNCGTFIHHWPEASPRFCGHPAASGVGEGCYARERQVTHASGHSRWFLKKSGPDSSIPQGHMPVTGARSGSSPGLPTRPLIHCGPGFLVDFSTKLKTNLTWMCFRRRKKCSGHCVLFLLLQI